MSRESFAIGQQTELHGMHRICNLITRLRHDKKIGCTKLLLLLSLDFLNTQTLVKKNAKIINKGNVNCKNVLSMNEHVMFCIHFVSSERVPCKTEKYFTFPLLNNNQSEKMLINAKTLCGWTQAWDFLKLELKRFAWQDVQRGTKTEPEIFQLIRSSDLGRWKQEITKHDHSFYLPYKQASKKNRRHDELC